MSDLYDVLGVAHTADHDTIRAAYRNLARAHHPDTGGEERHMMQINEAWRVLGDPTQRASYDAQLSRPVRRNPRERDGHTVLDFGRYEGWSLRDISNADEDYLEWLRRTPFGRPLRAEIAQILDARAAALAALRPPVVEPRKRWGRR